MSAGKASVECWSCGADNTIIYGPESEGIHECDNCGSVIAESSGHSIGIAESKEDADNFIEREKEKEEEEKWGGCIHPPDRVIPNSYSASPRGSLSLSDLFCLECGGVIPVEEYMEMRQ